MTATVVQEPAAQRISGLQSDGDTTMDTIAILRTLVGFDTTSRLSNLPLVHWTVAYLEEHGARTRLSYDDDGRKANVLASIGPDRVGGVVLSGHTDVVPVDGQDPHRTSNAKSFRSPAMPAMS
jgi:YD repeat-containing protein